jgi:tRNA pseudouridine38-40 synthase
MAVMTRYFLQLSYNGATFSGWQFQPGLPTVQGELERALSALLHEKITVLGCGRTDAGVHATKYYAHIDTAAPGLENDQQFLFRLNKTLHEGIAVQRVFKAADNSHARFSARMRTYEYFISRNKNPFQKDQRWLLHEDLDIGKLNDAAAIISQQSEFISFSKSGNDSMTTLCTIHESAWRIEDDVLIYRISANRFLRCMVRMLVGTMVEHAKGRISAEHFKNIFLAKKQPDVVYIAPANGLFLIDIEYAEGILPNA